MPDAFWTPQVVAAVAGLGGVVMGSLISWGCNLAFLASALAPTKLWQSGGSLSKKSWRSGGSSMTARFMITGGGPS